MEAFKSLVHEVDFIGSPNELLAPIFKERNNYLFIDGNDETWNSNRKYFNSFEKKSNKQTIIKMPVNGAAINVMFYSGRNGASSKPIKMTHCIRTNDYLLHITTTASTQLVICTNNIIVINLQISQLFLPYNLHLNHLTNIQRW